jgi:hypothetical protein
MPSHATWLDLIWGCACVLAQHLRYALTQLRQYGIDAFEGLPIYDNLQHQQRQSRRASCRNWMLWGCRDACLYPATSPNVCQVHWCNHACFNPVADTNGINCKQQAAAAGS